MTTATTATGGAPFAGMTDEELEELRRCVMHSLVLNQDEAIDLHEQLRLIRMEEKARARQIEHLTNGNRLREVSK